MSTVWMVVQVVLGVIGSILVWVAIAGIVADFRDRHRSGGSGRTPHKPPARL